MWTFEQIGFVPPVFSSPRKCHVGKLVVLKWKSILKNGVVVVVVILAKN